MAELTSHIGNRVTFTNPTRREPEYGLIQDEIWAREPNEFADIAPPDNGWREGAFVVQLIRLNDGYRSIRFTYYLRPEGGGRNTWYFGGQYAPSMGLDDYRSLLGKIGRTRSDRLGEEPVA